MCLFGPAKTRHGTLAVLSGAPRHRRDSPKPKRWLRMISKKTDRARLGAEGLLDLRNLVVAIDHRLPRLLHPDEAAIAKDAAELRARAAAMIAQLEALPVEAAGG